MDDKTVVKTAVKVSMVTIIVNVILSLLKLLAGIIGKSMVMISDSIHSLSDVFSSVIVIIGVRVSKREEDQEHQYGHDRMECLASLALGAILFVTGVLLIYEGIRKFTPVKYQYTRNDCLNCGSYFHSDKRVDVLVHQTVGR